MSEINITAANFEQEVLKSDIPVLLDFWAAWCGPCRKLGPVLEEIAAANTGKVKVGKVNVDEQPQLAARFGVDAIPAIFVVKNGQVVNSTVGYQSREALERLLH